jgi:hypothetical protein
MGRGGVYNLSFLLTDISKEAPRCCVRRNDEVFHVVVAVVIFGRGDAVEVVGNGSNETEPRFLLKTENSPK